MDGEVDGCSGCGAGTSGGGVDDGRSGIPVVGGEIGGVCDVVVVAPEIAGLEMREDLLHDVVGLLHVDHGPTRSA